MCKAFKTLLLIVVFISGTVKAQFRPSIYKEYQNNEDQFITNNLILSSDGLFFNFSSCECGKAYYAKGTYQIKGKKLYLSGFDSTLSFPHSKIELKAGKDLSDSVTITSSNYFNQPLSVLMLGLINKDSTLNPFYEPVDKQGRIHVSKKDYIGFYLPHEMQADSGLVDQSKLFHFFEAATYEAHVHVDFVDVDFVRPIAFNFGNQTFKMRKGKLFGKGKKPLFNTSPN
jgi:hypothetical protein